MEKIVLITGPTASGKTALAHALAKDASTCLINADSKQFYKNIDIATAKPSLAEQKQFSYSFLSFLELHEKFSAYSFLQKLMAFIQSQKKKTFPTFSVIL